MKYSGGGGSLAVGGFGAVDDAVCIASAIYSSTMLKLTLSLPFRVVLDALGSLYCFLCHLLLPR